MHRITMFLLASITVITLNNRSTQADIGDQLFKLLDDDGVSNGQFGRSVAIGGATGKEIAIVGAWWQADPEIQTSCAYLFDVNTGQEIAQLLPNDGEVGDWFGLSVAISSTVAVVGAPYDDDNGSASGSVYLFDLSDPTSPLQVSKLLPNDGEFGDAFGFSVAIGGLPGMEIAIIGAYGNNDYGPDSGSAYLFDINTGQQLFKLLPDDGEVENRFGFSVAISEDTAIIGAYQDHKNGIFYGSAYLFDIYSGRQKAKILPDDNGAWEDFGFSVGISGNIAIVGAPNDNENGVNSGSAYLFSVNDGKQFAQLLPNDGAYNDWFGSSVGISGCTAIVGAWRDDDNGSDSGSAYLFDTATAQQIAKLLPDDGAAVDMFGHTLAISGSAGNEIAIVGAWKNDIEENIDAGSAYLFDAASLNNCPWDINCDGKVGVQDLMEVIHNMGICEDPDNCPWDIDGNGVVNGQDVKEVATHIGDC